MVSDDKAGCELVGIKLARGIERTKFRDMVIRQRSFEKYEVLRVCCFSRRLSSLSFLLPGVILEIQRAPPTRVRPHARERAWVDCDTNDACDDGIPGTSGDQHCTRACESCRAR